MNMWVVMRMGGLRGIILRGEFAAMSDLEKLAAEIVRQARRHSVDDFDSEINWLTRCVADGRDKVKAAHPQSAQTGVPHWKDLNALADEYVDGYEFRGDEGDYQPTDRERFLIEDCVAGLMDEVHQMLKRATPQPAGDWVKPSERLPDDESTRLALVNDYDKPMVVPVRYFADTEQWFDVENVDVAGYQHTLYEVILWCDPPTPPTAQGGEGDE